MSNSENPINSANLAIPVKFPKLLLSRLETFFPQYYQQILTGFGTQRLSSFRVNTLSSSSSEIESTAKELGFSISPVEGIPGAYTLASEDEYSFKGSNIFRSGKIYMQSISSMLPPLVLNPSAGSDILDVCAAPGGKTSQMAAMMKNTGKIVAIEQNMIRMDKLRHTLQMQGVTNVVCEKMDARKFFAASEAKFDGILLDVPCSAEGRMNFGNEKSYGFFSLKNILEKSELQLELLSDAFLALKSGGKILYSTCTLAPEENEGVITRFLEKFGANARILPVQIPVQGIIQSSGLNSYANNSLHPDCTKAARIYPNAFAEGFFLCLIEKC